MSKFVKLSEKEYKDRLFDMLVKFDKLYKKRNLIQELLNANISKRKIAVICKVDRNTLARYIKTFLVET